MVWPRGESVCVPEMRIGHVMEAERLKELQMTRIDAYLIGHPPTTWQPRQGKAGD